MAALLRQMKGAYNFISYDLTDPRTRDYLASPSVLLAIPLYLYFCISLGPRLMKDAKPFKLKRIIFYYNIFQIFICAYIFYEGSLVWINEYSWTCQPVEMADTPGTRRMHNAAWWYTIVKFIDLLDTVFFVLRKKDRQITFLHLFHHSLMPFASFCGYKYYPNGHGTLLGVINSIVHVIMYTYYMISGLGPKYRKYVWWKKHLTTLQLIQFGVLFIHNLLAIYFDCGYPKWISAILCTQAINFLYMFGKFYYKTYIKNAKKNDQNGSVHSGITKVN